MVAILLMSQTINFLSTYCPAPSVLYRLPTPRPPA